MSHFPPASYAIDYKIAEETYYKIHKSDIIIDIDPIYNFILSNHKEMVEYLNLDISYQIDSIVLEELIKLILDSDKLNTPDDIYRLYIKLENNIYLSYQGDIVIETSYINKYVIEYTKSIEAMLMNIINTKLENKYLLKGDINLDSIFNKGDFFVMNDVDISINGGRTNMLLYLTLYEFVK